MRQDYRTKYAPTQMLQRLAQNDAPENAAPERDASFELGGDERQVVRVRAFFKMASRRKRQILERMLSDWPQHA